MSPRKIPRACGNKTQDGALFVLEHLESRHLDADRCSRERESGRFIMIKSDLYPPRAGLNADPVLYGVAAGLAKLFPPDALHDQTAADDDAASEGDGDRIQRDAE